MSDIDRAVFTGLLADLDVGVRKATVKAVGDAQRADLQPDLERLAEIDTAELVRDLARSTADQLG